MIGDNVTHEERLDGWWEQYVRERCTPEDTHRREMIRTALEGMVPLLIEEVRRWPWDERLRRAKGLADVIGEKAAGLVCGRTLPGERGDVARCLHAVALGVAIGAYVPGGITLFGDHWEARDE